jgi:hypothetical protein
VAHSYLLRSYSRCGNVVLDDPVEVDAAALQQWRRGTVVQQMPRFSVVLPLVLFVAGAEADGLFAAGDSPRDDVPDISRNAVNREVVEVGLLVAVVGAAGVDQAGDEVAGLQVACLEHSGFDLHAYEAPAQIDHYVVLGGVAYGLGELVAEFGGFGHKTKLSPLAALFVVANIHAGSFQSVPCVAKCELAKYVSLNTPSEICVSRNKKGAAAGPRLPVLIFTLSIACLARYFPSF